MATILVAEDEDAIRTLVALTVQAAGHHVITATNGVEAVSRFRFSPDRFDLVITDLKMPVMSGLALIKLIRDTKPSMKIICISGYSEDQVPEGVELLRKPFQLDALRSCVEKLLSAA
jgi:two-component system cell cycle sensor histidine kinase/response regulator CckA